MLKEVRRIVERARTDEDVLAVMVFGSYARKEMKVGDIDVCIILQPKVFDKLFMSNKKLVYLELVPEGYDIHIFQQLPAFIRVRILKEGKILLNKDYDALFKIALSSIKEFELFKKHYHYCIEKIAYGR